MIVDTSAILAILFREPDAEHYATAIALASSCRMSVAALVEATMVLESRGGVAAGYELDAFLEEAEIKLEPVTSEQAQVARRAWRRFGKGHHRPG
ncbi:MAG: type II toxin-antitoxin system VapC family toxin [Caldilineaceae bacterium]|nr:type II toxin-antitoxin system VapC family toxin [Caldilineaceae bacterium]